MRGVLILLLYLTSDPVGCYDVTGYPGGNIIMYVAHNQYGQPENYFCKETSNEHTFIKSKQTRNMWKHKGRLSLYDSSEGLIVIYRNLSLQDTRLYQCGATGVWNRTVNLEVNTDPCCLGPKTLTGYLGETVNISCSYPKKFKKNIKLFYKADGRDFSEVIRTTDSKKERVSISEDGRSRVVSVTIRDVREDDGGVYYCGVGTVEESVSFNSLYSELHLQVTAKGVLHTSNKEPPTRWYSTLEPNTAAYRSTSTAQATTTSDVGHFSSSLVIIIVCVSVALLLIGGSGLIFYRLRCTKTQDSTFISSQSGSSTTRDNNYEYDPVGNLNNIRMGAVDQNRNKSQKPNTNQSDSIYESLDPNTMETDSVYQSLKPNTNQTDSVYQTLKPNTNQSDSVYQSLKPSTNQSDSVYQSLNSNTNQSD